MVLTRISVTLLLLVGIMSVAFAAPDRSAELEKSNKNADALDVPVAAERSNRPVELEEEDENGDVQYGRCRYYYYCFVRYIKNCRRRCSRHAYYCKKQCYFYYRKCLSGRRVTQDDEETIQQDFATPDEPEAVERPDRLVELEEEGENGDVQYGICRYYYYCFDRYIKNCRRRCSRHVYYYKKQCYFYYRKCLSGRRVTQDDEETIQQDFATPDEPEAVKDLIDLLNWKRKTKMEM